MSNEDSPGEIHKRAERIWEQADEQTRRRLSRPVQETFLGLTRPVTNLFAAMNALIRQAISK
jgi:hypothetical protein